MKTNLVKMAVLAVAAAATALPAFAGQTQAGREWELRHGADPESAQGIQVRPPVETGSVNADNARQLKPESAAETGVPTMEIGGRVYRIGIDTP